MSCCFLQEKLFYLGPPQVAVLSGDVHLLQHGVSTLCSGDVCFGIVFHGLHAGSLLHHGLQRGSLLWQLERLFRPSLTSVSVPWLSLIFFSLTPHCHAAFIKCSFAEVQPPWLRDTAWAPAANAPVCGRFNRLVLFISMSLELWSFKHADLILFTYFNLGNSSIPQRKLT